MRQIYKRLNKLAFIISKLFTHISIMYNKYILFLLKEFSIASDWIKFREINPKTRNKIFSDLSNSGILFQISCS